jgi:hypothetical protein
MNFKSIYILILLLAFTLSTNVASAQVDGQVPPKPPMKGEFKKEMEVRKEVRKEERKEIRTERKDDVKELRASTTMMKKEMKEMRKNGEATTSEMFKKMKDKRQELTKSMRKDTFEIRKNALIKELKIVIDNLVANRTKISDRITKIEAEGKDVTAAKADLVIADEKIAKAKTAVDGLATLVAPEVKTKTASPTEVDLSKPRQAGDAAIKAVKDARDALKKVVSDLVMKVGTENKVPAKTTTETSAN